VNVLRRLGLPLFLVALVGAIWPLTAFAAATDPLLGTSGNYAVLASATITSTGPSWITGKMALSPGTSITGFPPGTSGVQDINNGAALQARNDAIAAYNRAAGEPGCTSTGVELGSTTLGPGLYCNPTMAISAGLTLTLNGGGVYIFQIGSTLTTASNSSVLVINGGSDCNVFWQVGSSATLGTTTAFKGNILALASITLNTSANIDSGRALARNGAVTMDTNDVSIAGCAPAPTKTPLPATQTAVAPTETAIAATQTAVATQTGVPPPPTQTAIAATQTVIAATNTAIAPTETAIAATLAPSLTAIAATQTATAMTPAPTNTATRTPTRTRTPSPRTPTPTLIVLTPTERPVHHENQTTSIPTSFGILTATATPTQAVLSLLRDGATTFVCSSIRNAKPCVINRTGTKAVRIK